MNWSNLRKFLFSVCILTALIHSIGQTYASSDEYQSPKLVILISIDAFRYDYFTRFEKYLSKGGFKVLLENGANFNNAHIYHYRPTTAPGHAAMMTGASGHNHGIVDSDFWDRELREKVNCVEDREAILLKGQNQTDGQKSKKGRSAKKMLVTTVGDELKLSNNFKSKVIGIGFKDRAAILPSGKLANTAYWFDVTTGKFISSTFYLTSLPEWVYNFNQQNSIDHFFKRTWEKVLDEQAYTLSRQDDFPNELDYKGLRNVFPHPVHGNLDKPGADFYDAFMHSPFADEHLADFAKAVIENENLGEDEITDILTIGFSATDRIGHAYGIYSQEIQDQIIRLDRILEGFLTYADKKIGLDNILIILTAGHGFGPIPEYMAQLHFDAGRIETALPSGAHSIVIPKTVELALDNKFGSADWVEAFIKPNVYLNYETITAKNLELNEVEKTAQNALTQIKGIQYVFTRTQILSGNLPEIRISQKVSEQFHPRRSGDLVVVVQPYYIQSFYKKGPDKGASHETDSANNTHIPMIFYGQKFKPGIYRMPVKLNDLAPTLSSVLQIAFPSGNEGRVLFEALY